MEEDKRFTHIKNDPKFRCIPKGESKVKIDKRFQSMFTDKKFQIKYTTDKRGRPVKHHSSEDLKRYYELDSEEDTSESEDDAEVGTFVKALKSDSGNEEATNELQLKYKCDKKLPQQIKEKLKNLTVDYARGESNLFSGSSSDDDEETDDELSEAEEIDHKWGELDGDAGTTDEVTHRLAACNMDWDRIRAVDLMVLFNSFLPAGGVIESVIIYPSKFGKQRMQEEEVKGPIELVALKNDEVEDENEEGSKYHMEKLRQYQLNRLKYYYAVITFNNNSSANKVYTECDGMEYESSSTKMDLRFIPYDMTFDDEPKEYCNKLPELNKYQPRFFTTTALQQAKVDLTWDETNPDRLEIAEKLNSGKIEEVSEADLQNYLGGGSDAELSSDEETVISEEDSDEEKGNVINKYKALLQDIEEKEKAKKDKDIEMEVTWGINLKEKTEKLVKKKIAEAEKTPFQQYLDKRKEKRKEKQKQKKKDEDSESDVPSDIDMNDPYFAEEFSNSEFKKPKKKIDLKEDNEDTDEQKEAELELLLMNESDGKKHFSLKKIQAEENITKSKKRRNKKDKKEIPDDDFQVNVEDARFSALFSSHHYNIDPTDPHYKKTKAMETLINEKLKRRNNYNQDKEKKPKLEEKKKNTELNLLVKSVKRKTQAFKQK